MKFLIIIPAHNEEANILSCLESLKNQTFQDYKCVVVNDGSTDKTQQIVHQFIQLPVTNNYQVPATNYQLPITNHQLINLEKSEHQPGAKVVQTFNKGLESQDLNDFDVICKFDADIIFPPDYLEKVNEVYEKNPKAGMVSGLVYIKKGFSSNQSDKNDFTDSLFDFTQDTHWQFENLSSKNHIRGPIKSYRKECFQEMNGLRAVLGWDNLDVMLAKMYGWKTVTIKDLWVKHLRPTAYKYKSQKAEKLGEYFYNIGLDLPLAMISSMKSSLKNKSVSEFFITLKSYLKQNGKRELSDCEIQFIRTLRWKEISKKLGK